MGCYGPAEGILDQGAKMLAALGSVVDIGSYKGLSEQQIAERADGVFDSIPDQAGAFYKFSLAGSILGGRLR
jgi:F420-non-reducing hydrogenase small subunit